MSRLLPVLAVTAILALAACTGATTPGTAGAGSPEPAASVPASASAPAASTATGTGACAPSTEPGTVQAGMTGSSFAPSTIEAKVGDVIAWTNSDSVPHTATVRDDPTCTTENLGQGDTGGLTFSAAGTYAFFCKIHSDMTGTIEVTG
jgi:plastocyanin